MSLSGVGGLEVVDSLHGAFRPEVSVKLIVEVLTESILYGLYVDVDIGHGLVELSDHVVDLGGNSSFLCADSLFRRRGENRLLIIAELVPERVAYKDLAYVGDLVGLH